MPIKPKAKASNIDVWCSHDKVVDIDSLIANPRNPNKHPQRQIEMLAKIIRNQGWRYPIKISNRSGFIVSGHCRLEAAKILNLKSVPVDYQDYENEALEYADLIADNRIAELADHDLNEAAKLIAELDIDAELAGFSDSEVEKLLKKAENISTEVTDKDKNKNKKPVFKLEDFIAVCQARGLVCDICIQKVKNYFFYE